MSWAAPTGAPPPAPPPPPPFFGLGPPMPASVIGEPQSHNRLHEDRSGQHQRSYPSLAVCLWGFRMGQVFFKEGFGGGDNHFVVVFGGGFDLSDLDCYNNRFNRMHCEEVSELLYMMLYEHKTFLCACFTGWGLMTH